MSVQMDITVRKIFTVAARPNLQSLHPMQLRIAEEDECQRRYPGGFDRPLDNIPGPFADAAVSAGDEDLDDD